MLDMTEEDAIVIARSIVVPLLAASKRSPIIRDSIDTITRLFAHNPDRRAKATEYVRRVRATRLYDAMDHNPTLNLVLDLARAIMYRPALTTG